jgi:hypothetical protein
MKQREQGEVHTPPFSAAANAQPTRDHIAVRLLRMKTKENEKSFVPGAEFGRVGPSGWPGEY